MRDEPTMALFSLSGVNAADGKTHVQLCLGSEDADAEDQAPYFLTITIAGDPDEDDGGRSTAQRFRLPLQHRDLANLQRWITTVL